MDNELLEILKRLDNKFDNLENKFDKLENRFDKLEEGQQRIEKKLDSVHDQTADLTEFRTETKDGLEAIKKDINKLTNVTKTNCFEIADLKAVK